MSKSSVRGMGGDGVFQSHMKVNVTDSG